MDSNKLVVHCKKEPYDVYIGRPSKWGNPFTHLDKSTRAEFKVATRDEAVAAYEEYIRNKPELLADLHELKGKVLGCWCKPKSCHGDILVKLIKEEYLKFAKTITDRFILMVTGELPISYFHGEMSDGPPIIPTENEQREYFTENNKFALAWLKDNMLSYDEWVTKN